MDAGVFVVPLGALVLGGLPLGLRSRARHGTTVRWVAAGSQGPTSHRRRSWGGQSPAAQRLSMTYEMTRRVPEADETGTFGPAASRASDGSDRSPWFTGRLCSKIQVWVSSRLSNRWWVARRDAREQRRSQGHRQGRPDPRHPGGTRPQRGDMSTLPPGDQSRWNTPGPGGPPQRPGRSNRSRAMLLALWVCALLVFICLL